jgi:hypothetical protein
MGTIGLTGIKNMDNTTFGLTLLVVGMGGTLLTLWALTGVIHLLVRFFPQETSDKQPPKA